MVTYSIQFGQTVYNNAIYGIPVPRPYVQIIWFVNQTRLDEVGAARRQLRRPGLTAARGVAPDLGPGPAAALLDRPRAGAVDRDDREIRLLVRRHRTDTLLRAQHDSLLLELARLLEREPQQLALAVGPPVVMQHAVRPHDNDHGVGTPSCAEDVSLTKSHSTEPSTHPCRRCPCRRCGSWPHWTTERG